MVKEENEMMQLDRTLLGMVLESMSGAVHTCGMEISYGKTEIK